MTGPWDTEPATDGRGRLRVGVGDGVGYGFVGATFLGVVSNLRFLKGVVAVGVVVEPWVKVGIEQ